jgi:fructose-bisphosphate aldolase class II
MYIVAIHWTFVKAVAVVTNTVRTASEPRQQETRMPLARTGDLVNDAAVGGTGVCAFNIITLEHAEAIVAGAELAGLPVVLQLSENAVRFHGGNLRPIAAAAVAVAQAANVPVSLHLDHIESTSLLYQAADAGFSSAMFDASKLDYEANVAATAAAVEWGHDRGLFIEAELGEVGGKDGVHAPGVRTNPHDANTFVASTGVDALAVAVGSSHAMVDRTARLDHDLICSLRSTVRVPLVLHGSSGVPDDELAQAVRGGIIKVNIATILNVTFTGVVREVLDGDPALVDPRKYLAPARSQMSELVARMLSLLSKPATKP